LSIYVDSSFIVSIYIADAHSAQADSRFASRPRPWFTPLHDAEFTHAVERGVFRGAITPSSALKVHEGVQRDLRGGLWLRTDWPMAAFAVSVQLARAHIAHTGGRTLDTLHVAAALELGATEFWTFDERQAKLAVIVGLKVV
jgi:predicted nucleic acid-binding protein